MDRLIYIAMTGAQQAMHRQAVTSHNLANASTTGFKAETVAHLSAQVAGPGLPARAYAMAASTGTDHAAGALQRTGRDLDVAIQGEGFFAVQALDGNEAYTRSGSFRLSPEGELQSAAGLPVLGEGGPLSIPPDSKVTIAADGTLSAVDAGQSAANVVVVGKLKLVNPGAAELVRGADGLFRARGGEAPSDPAVTVTSGAVEDSNVNAVASMVDMINLARQFDLHMKMLQSADDNARRADQLLANA